MYSNVHVYRLCIYHFLHSTIFLEDHALKIAKTLIEGVQILHVTTMQQIQLNAHAEPQAL